MEGDDTITVPEAEHVTALTPNGHDRASEAAAELARRKHDADRARKAATETQANMADLAAVEKKLREEFADMRDASEAGEGLPAPVKRGGWIVGVLLGALLAAGGVFLALVLKNRRKEIAE